MNHPVITGWSAVSPFGIGRAAFTTGLHGDARCTPVKVDAEWPLHAGVEAFLVPDFDVRETLGRKGTKSLDRLTGLTATAVGRLLGEDHTLDGGAGVAFVLGTTMGSLHSAMDFTREGLTGRKPYDVSPALLPNAIMNRAAAECAIRYGLTGPNTTLAGGRTAGLLALAQARRLLAAGRADRVIVGAAEEYSASRAWLAGHNQPGTVLGEGCGVLVLERPETAQGPGVLALEFRNRPDDPGAALAECVHGLLDRGGVRPDDVWAAVPAGPHETDALAGLFGARALHRIPPVDRIGDTDSASATFGILAALSTVQGKPRVVVVGSLDPGGTAAAALLRLPGEPGR